MVSSDYPLLSSDYPLVSSDYPLVSSDYPLVSSDYPLVSSDYPLVSSDYPLVSSDYPLVSSDYHVKMPFGLCNAPSTFQRCVELILRGLQWKTLLIYIDEIVIYSSNMEVLGRLSKAGLKLKPSKCDFFQE